MVFLGFWSSAWDIITGKTDVLSVILTGIVTGLNYVFYTLAKMINIFIRYVYNLFYILSTQRLLSNSQINLLAKRIGVLLGLVMVFIVIFSCIKMLLDPDKISDKTNGIGNVIKRVLIVIIGLGISTTAFTLLYNVQNAVINSNIISKLLLPLDVNTDDFGAILEAEIFSTFYRFNENIDPDTSDDAVRDCYELTETIKGDIIEGNYETGYECLGTKVTISPEDGGKEKLVNVIEFHGVMLLLFSIAAIYFLFGYCISVGMRTIQLAFLEIISPVAIISYLAPTKDGMFNKWLKTYFSTYIDLFIRIAIINFAVYLVGAILDAGALNLDGVGGMTKLFARIVMITAILGFAKKAPELIKSIFPSSGASGLGLGTNSMAAGLIGLGTGTAIGTVAEAIGEMHNTPGGWKNGGWRKKLSALAHGAGHGGWNGAKAGINSKKPGDLLKNGKAAWNNSYSAGRQAAAVTAAGGSRNPISRLRDNKRLRDDDNVIEGNSQKIRHYTAAEEAAKKGVEKNASNYLLESSDKKINAKSLLELEKLKDDQTQSAEDRALFQVAYNQLYDKATEFNLSNDRAAENAQVNFMEDGSVMVLDNDGNEITSDNYESIGKTNENIAVHMNALSDDISSIQQKDGSITRAAAAKQAKNNAETQSLQIQESPEYQRAKASSNNSKK